MGASAAERIAEACRGIIRRSDQIAALAEKPEAELSRIFSLKEIRVTNGICCELALAVADSESVDDLVANRENFERMREHVMAANDALVLRTTSNPQTMSSIVNAEETLINLLVAADPTVRLMAGFAKKYLYVVKSTMTAFYTDLRLQLETAAGKRGGRIAVHLTGKGNDFSSYLGAIDACSPNRGGCGTVYLQTGDEEFGKGKVVIANSGTQTQQTQLPSPRICDPKELSRRVRVEVATGGVLGLTKDLNVDDLTMDGNSKLYLNGHTLFIYHRRHALGTKASQIVPGGTAENPGRIIWLQGLMLMVK